MLVDDAFSDVIELTCSSVIDESVMTEMLIILNRTLLSIVM